MDFIPQPYASFMAVLGAGFAVTLAGLKLIQKLTSNGVRKSMDSLCKEHVQKISSLETSMEFVREEIFPELKLQINNRFDKIDRSISNIHNIIRKLK